MALTPLTLVLDRFGFVLVRSLFSYNLFFFQNHTDIEMQTMNGQEVMYDQDIAVE